MRVFAILCAFCLWSPAAWAAESFLSATVEAVPTTGSIPQGAQRVGMLTVALAADCKADVTVTSLEVTHMGLGSARDLSRLYLLEGSQRISRGAAPSDKDPTTLRLKAFTVPACGSRTLTVAADFSASAAAAGEHRLSLEAVEASAPVTIEAASARLIRATVTPSADTPQVTAAFLPVRTSQLYGGNRTLARVRLSNEGDHAVIVTAVTFTNDGSARDADLQDIALYASDGTRLSEAVEQLEGSIVRLDIDTVFRLDSRDEKVLELRGDVRASRKRTIEFIVEEASDVEAAAARRR